MKVFKKGKKAIVTGLLVVSAACTLASCGGNKKPPVTINEDIVNGGFEEGDLTGWKTEGDYAFDAEGVVEASAVEGLDITVTGKVGKYYFNGLAAANATSTGTLTSEPFKLSGIGKLGFKIGAGSDASKCYVEICEYETNEVLAKVSNEAYDAGFIEDELVRVVVDLSAHLDKNVYIKVTDNGTTQKSHEYLHLDDFVMYKTEAEVNAAKAEREALIRAYGRPVFENDTPTALTIKNGNFEDGLNNWKVLSGDAYTPKSIKSSKEKFWDTREYNAEGNYFLDGFLTGEDRVGELRSTTFTLGNTGIISFLLSSANHTTIYVAVCNDEAIGDIAADTELFTVNAKEVFKDNELSENMLRRYINAKTYTEEGKDSVDLIGKKLYIKLVDKRDGGDFGAVCFDDVRCSMTEAEVIALEKTDYEWAMSLTGRGSEEIRYTQNYYSNYAYPIALPIMRFQVSAESVALKASADKVNLTAYIENVVASYGDVEASEFAYSITKVNYNGTDVTTGFEEFVLDAAGIAAVTYQASYNGMTIDGVFYIDVTNENQIQNGGFETGNLAGWTVVEGAINVGSAVSGAEYGWTGASYNHSGAYHFDGVNSAPENQTYGVRSSNFVLGGAGIISFKLGGRAATLRVYDATSGVCLAEYKNTLWNDENNPHVEQGCRNLTMTTYYADLSQYFGMTLYIELADTETSNWGVAHFDDIITYYVGKTDEVLADLIGRTDKVNYTCEGSTMTTDIAWCEAENNITPELVQIVEKAPSYNEVYEANSSCDLNTYLDSVKGAVIGVTNPTLIKEIVEVVEGSNKVTAGFDQLTIELGKVYEVKYAVSYNDGTETYTSYASFIIKGVASHDIKNAGFELGSLEGWTYVEGTENGQINANALCKDETFWGERIPFNKTGNYFFNGWNACSEEPNGYHLTSTSFTLAGSGYISFKMGGNAAAVKVYKKDGTLVAQYNNTEFNDAEFPHVEKGGRWATMTTFVADLSSYIGEELYIELHDLGAAPWGVAFFDEIVTYHAEAPVVAEGKDVYNVYCEDPAGTEYEMPWVEAVNVAD